MTSGATNGETYVHDDANVASVTLASQIETVWLPDYSLTFDRATDLVTLWTSDGGKRLRRMIRDVRDRGINRLDAQALNLDDVRRNASCRGENRV